MESLARTANRGSVSTGYDIDNSIMFSTSGTYADSNSYTYHLMNPGGDDNWSATSTNGTNARKVTVSLWFKRTLTTESGHYPRLFDYRAGGVAFSVYLNTSDQLQMYDDNTSMSLKSNQVFRDVSAWYHMVFAIDQTQSTGSNRVKVYVNGEQITSWATEDYGNQNVDLSCFRADSVNFYIGGAANDAGAYFNGYITEYHFIDGQQLAQTEFGEFSDDGIWIPKQFTGSYGILGHYYNFSNSSDMGEDFSGNNNDANNRGSGIANGSARQSTDTPTNNFCTLNSLNTASNGGGNVEYSDGATKGKTLQTDEPASGTMAVTKGKWYFECKAVSNSDMMAGYGVPNKWGNHTNNPGYDVYSFAVHSVGRVYYYGNSYIDLSPSVSYDTNDIISVALDADNGFCYFAKNGTYMNGGSPTSGSTGTGGFNYLSGSTGANMEIVDGDFLIPAFRTNYYTNSSVLVNFGGYTTISISSGASDGNGYGTFEYAPPSGYYSLCTKNLAEYG